MAKAKKLSSNYPVPQSDVEADAMIFDLGVVRRELVVAEAAMNDEIAAIRQRHEQQAEPLKQREAAVLGGLEMWAAANRERLTNGGRVKFYRFASGELKWRTRPPRVSVRGQEAVIETLRSLGLVRFVRIKEEVNKEAMLAEPEVARAVAGVSIGTEGEDFVVEPYEEVLAPAIREVRS